jgi:hypothetical protein
MLFLLVKSADQRDGVTRVMVEYVIAVPSLASCVERSLFQKQQAHNAASSGARILYLI